MTKFSHLPTDLMISCIARVPISNYRLLSLTSKLMASMLTSSELFVARSIERSKETLLYCCFMDSNQVPRWYSFSKKPEIANQSPRFWLTDIPTDDLYSNSRVMVGLDRCIYMISSEIETAEEERGSSSRLKILNCVSHEWSETEPMLYVRNNSAVLLKFGDEICVLGGIKDERSLKPEVFSPQSGQWSSLPEPDLGSNPSVILMNSDPDGQIEVWSKSAGEAMRSSYDRKGSKWFKGTSFLGPVRSSRSKSLTVAIGCWKVRIVDGQIYCYDKDKVTWKMFVKGFDEFETHPFHVMPYDDNMLALWNESSEGREEVWCAEVSIERCGDEVFGKLLWKNMVKNLEGGYNFLGSSTVRL